MKSALFFSFLFMSLNLYSATEAEFKRIIKKHHFAESTLGLYVEDEGKKIIDINAEKLMVPASLTKIVTGAAILNKLSLNTKFKTELWSNATVEAGSLKGALCFKGGGDPSFVSEKMWYLVNEFVRTGVKTIEGDLIIDGSRFDSEFFDTGRESVRVDRAFDAPVSALSFNWNSVNVFVRPGAKADDPVKVFLDPANDYLELENTAKTVSKPGVKSIEVSRVKLGMKDKIIISGSLSQNAGEMVVYKSISNPVLWTASHFKEFLGQRGITVKGYVKEGECAPDSKLMAFVNSKNLNEIISDMLKFSNNFVAEMLAKNLAAEESSSKGKHASMKEGIESIKTYLDKQGLNRKDYVLENVSGLTRDNRFSPKQLALILTSLKNDFLNFPEFLSGLPIAGVEGSL
jgi:D-alanyl-D-alanine carboxypeptidase/D-alanyl-D-alanine-endopeptidase (penicillin-binding protein 4)